MAVRKKIPYSSGIFSVTFTCARWLPLFEITNGYNIVYKFFDKLKSDGHFINAYVIMPDHVHAILSFTYTEKSINRILIHGLCLTKPLPIGWCHEADRECKATRVGDGERMAFPPL